MNRQWGITQTQSSSTHTMMIRTHPAAPRAPCHANNTKRATPRVKIEMTYQKMSLNPTATEEDLT